MTASIAPAPERRRFPRYTLALPVTLRRKSTDLTLFTVDISRHGAFVRCDPPPPLRQLVQLRFHLPGFGEIDAMCMVARSLQKDHPRGPGMGVDFFALSKDAKVLWERHVQAVKGKGAARLDVVEAAVPLVQSQPLFPTSPPQQLRSFHAEVPVSDAAKRTMEVKPLIEDGDTSTWLTRNSVGDAPIVRTDATPLHVAPSGAAPSGAAASGAAMALEQQLDADDAIEIELDPADFADASSTNLPPLNSAVVMMRLPDRAGLQAFVERDVARGGMFLKTPMTKEVGERLEIVVVHPETDEEFHLDGTVVRRVNVGPLSQRGLGIFFRALTPAKELQLASFVESGAEEIEVGTPIAQQQIDLESAVAHEPDSPELLEALGVYLLDHEGDLGGALTALTRALVLGPSVVAIHATMARAYRKIGDTVRVRAHERVAESLLLMQDRMKRQLGDS